MGVRANRQGSNGKYHNVVGRFFPQNPSKVAGNSSTIVYKSRLEYRMMAYLDRNPKIVKWCYESFPIKYLDKSSMPPKIRNYWIDFTAVAKTATGYKKIWIEVKSKRETQPPKSKKNVRENLTWIKNLSKWTAAKRLAESKGFQFCVVCEDQLT